MTVRVRVRVRVRVDHLGASELGHGGGQQLLREGGDDVGVGERDQALGVVEVARDDGALRLLAAPQVREVVLAAAVVGALLGLGLGVRVRVRGLTLTLTLT